MVVLAVVVVVVVMVLAVMLLLFAAGITGGVSGMVGLLLPLTIGGAGSGAAAAGEGARGVDTGDCSTLSEFLSDLVGVTGISSAWAATPSKQHTLLILKNNSAGLFDINFC